MKKIVYFLILFTSLVYSQEEKILVGVHYTQDISSKTNIFKMQGIAGLDLKYEFLDLEKISLQVGLSTDLHLPKSNFDKFMKYDMSIIWNPNIGIVLNLNNSDFKPFINLGYAFYEIRLNVKSLGNIELLDDPYFANIKDLKYKYDSFTINPGIRYYFKKVVFLDANYKIFPVSKNYSQHFLNLGLGFRI